MSVGDRDIMHHALQLMLPCWKVVSRCATLGALTDNETSFIYHKQSQLFFPSCTFISVHSHCIFPSSLHFLILVCTTEARSDP